VPSAGRSAFDNLKKTKSHCQSKPTGSASNHFKVF